MQVKILELRKKGLTYQQIADQIGCSKSNVAYHCGDGQKEKYAKRLRKNRQKQHPYCRKTENFLSKPKSRITYLRSGKLQKYLRDKVRDFHRPGRKETLPMSFTFQDVVDKFGENPKCYLTGEPIDIYQPRTYHFDHKIPSSKGGPSTLDNLGICTKIANEAKRDMTPEEFIQFCQNVVNHNKK